MTEDELADLTERVLDDVLADVERDPVQALVVLIDAAIAAGNVTRCEPGAWNEYEPIKAHDRVRIMFRNRVRGQRIRAADGEGHAANANWTERWNARMRSALRVTR